MELERPEEEPVPGDWKRMGEFERLLLFRALRPDRLTAAMAYFVTNTIGKEYVMSQPFDLEVSFKVQAHVILSCYRSSLLWIGYEGADHIQVFWLLEYNRLHVENSRTGELA